MYGAQKLCLPGAGRNGHGRKTLRDKTAIGYFDRVALCPLAGHLTSSYWVAIRQPSGRKAEIHREALDLPLLNRVSGVSSFPRPATFHTAIGGPSAIQIGTAES